MPRRVRRSGQMPLPFPVRPVYDRDRYFVSSANQAAVSLVDRWPQWPWPSAAIYGTMGSGKTHLLHIWSDRANAELISGEDLGMELARDLPDGFRAAIDDADVISGTDDGATALFHLLNRAQQEGGWVLFAGTEHPSRWPTRLPDLRTRLSALATAEIGQPDDTLMAAVLTKLFTDLQLSAPPDLVGFIVARMERSIAAAARLAQAMDRETIGTGRTLSFELAERLITADARD